ncbi:unnamed protein product [Cyclocybe aegerita]|uniref:PH domain-containing protein n=1 Tax=Cyclocybe aegerita TaxID=1973307 RepID=A0A8S0XG49_CYCAE|nr:unnamed protein product [Cyclocybe aegerita]
MSNGAIVKKAGKMDGGEDAVLLTRLPKSASPTVTSFTRTTSPPLISRRPGALQDEHTNILRGMKLSKNTDLSLDSRPRSNSRALEKGKEPIRGDSIGSDATSDFGKYSSDHFTPRYNSGPGHTYDRVRPATTDGNNSVNANGRNKFRAGLLVAASDALGFKFGRRRPSIRQHPMPVILPDVIEISAPRADEEVEERNRLREIAAHAIGLGPFMVSPGSHSRDDSATDEDDEDQTPILDSAEMRPLGYMRNSESAPNIAGRSPHGSSLSIAIPQTQPPPIGRYRSGSILAHNPSTPTAIAPIPPFPSTVATLTSFRQTAGTYHKYYPPSSLRIFALSKSWKSRYLVLSTPATLVTRGQGPAVSYLHLFKSGNPDEQELERLEINEDSVVFVSEEEVGAKRGVIKVGGIDVGAMRKEYTHEEGGHIMWLLQIPDQADAQRWITNIKNAILGQRTVRAGLIPAHTLGNNEPRGDMDVMLSIRAQGLITAPITGPRSPTQATTPINVPAVEKNPNYASSISSRSIRSQKTIPKSSSPVGAVSALKGLFANSTRPRSASRAASIESERQQERADGNEESFTSMGSNLLSMLRSNTPDTQSINTSTTTTTRMNLPIAGPVGPIDRRIDRKILSDRQPIQWASTEPASLSKDRANRALSLGALSLQPPPRKRWTSASARPPTPPPSQDSTTENQPIGTVKRSSLSMPRRSIDRPETEPPSSPNLSGFRFGTPEEPRPRAPSVRSVSTYASGENGVGFERSSVSTKRSSGTRSARRWSRQGILPSRMPTEPPPPVPLSQTLHPYAAERAPSPISSHGSQQSVVSGLPTFSKRASGSSAISIGSLSTTYSQTGSTSPNVVPITIRTPPSHRSSMMPPPRPPPTSALPPAPVDIQQEDAQQDVVNSLEMAPTSSKSSFRNSVTNRTFRLSMIAPSKPPPSTTLPPRPDEPEYRTHRRSSSGSGTNGLITHASTKLESIPASPIPPAKTINPFPPPIGPLPPTPANSPSPTTSQQTTHPKRTTSFKQRLRILSAPSSSASPPTAKLQFSRSMTAGSVTTSPPGTPIAEKITPFQNDPSFLQMHTPILAPLPTPKALITEPSEEIAEVTSLSPPPRRGSKQLLESDLQASHALNSLVQAEAKSEPADESKHPTSSRPVSQQSQGSQLLLEGELERSEDIKPPPDEFAEEKLPSPVEAQPRHVSLSRPGSVISLGIMSM